MKYNRKLSFYLYCVHRSASGYIKFRFHLTQHKHLEPIFVGCLRKPLWKWIRYKNKMLYKRAIRAKKKIIHHPNAAIQLVSISTWNCNLWCWELKCFFPHPFVLLRLVLINDGFTFFSFNDNFFSILDYYFVVTLRFISFI